MGKDRANLCLHPFHSLAEVLFERASLSSHLQGLMRTMTLLYGNSPASTMPHQREYQAKTQAYLLKGKLTPAEITLLEIERRRLNLTPAEASKIEAEVKRSARQAKATRRGVLSVFLVGIGAMTLLLQTPVASRQAPPLKTRSQSSTVPVETFSSREQGAETLAKAQKIAEQRGELDVAIATASQIPSNSLLYPEAQIQILQWKQQQWRLQNEAFQRLQQAYGTQHWQAVLDIAMKEIPQNQYWLEHQGVLKMMVTAKAELFAAEKSAQR